MQDMALLQEYASSGSEAAFSEVVRRYVDMVHSAALRQLRNPDLAQEVTQAVFIVLARKAGRLPGNTVLSGWLLTTTRYAANSLIRGAVRRVKREEEYVQSMLNEPTAEAWEQVTPLLDEALAALGETDRNAIALRYFENKTAEEIGAALKLNKDAAQKRVARAIEKLRKIFGRRGVHLTTAIIAALISAHSVQAAPAGLAATVLAGAVQGAAGSATVAAIVSATNKMMAWCLFKTAAVAAAGVVVVAAVVTVAVAGGETQQQRNARQILRQVFHSYAALSSYSSTGTTIAEYRGSITNTSTSTFTMRLGRTNRYFVEYEERAPSFTNQGAAWSDGTADFFANDKANQTTRIPLPGPAQNLSAIWDVSGGATLIVPALFFNTQIPHSAPRATSPWQFDPTQWTDARLNVEPDETVDNTPCYVLSGKLDGGSVRLWIGNEDFLIHQSREEILDPVTDATDQEINQLLASAHAPAPLPMKEMKRRINDGRKQAATTGKTVTVVFTDKPATRPGQMVLNSMTVSPPTSRVFTQTHLNVAANPPLGPADFHR